MLKKVTIVCTGSVAVFTIPDLIIVLRRAYNCRIEVIMSGGATKFITPFGLSVVSGSKSLTESDLISDAELATHISDSDALLVAPATANTIAGLATGAGASLVHRAIMMFNGPVVIAPAMNKNMWKHKATIRNVSALKEMGAHFVGPSEGIEIATFEPSESAMASIDMIVEKLIEICRQEL